jgi:serine/threonine protein kinase
MSPEQSRGKALDARTDIWSFGCILYEMLTGRTVFARETLTDTVAAIIGKDPEWNALPGETPHLIHFLLKRCLEKDTNRRFHHMADVRIQIEDAVMAPAEITDLAPEVRTQSKTLWWSAGFFLTGVALAAIVLNLIPQKASDKASAMIPTSMPVRLTWDTGLTTEPSISADGHLIAYASDRGGDGISIFTSSRPQADHP